MRRRQKSNSICEAEGKPISISLKPIPTSIWKYSSFSSTLIGCASAWLPSRRSTLHQTGAEVRARFGHWRSGRSTCGKGRYLVTGGCCMERPRVAPQKPMRQVFKRDYPTISTTSAVALSRPEAAIEATKSCTPDEEVSIY